MKKILIATVALLVAGAAAPALGADLGNRNYYKAPAPAYAAPIYNWTGFYIGGHELIERAMKTPEAVRAINYSPSIGNFLTMRSLKLSRDKGAKAWELRVAIDLAQLLAEWRSRKDARQLLQTALEGFADGSETADIRAAGVLLATL